MRDILILGAIALAGTFACAPTDPPGHQQAPVINGTLTPEGMYPATGALMIESYGEYVPMCSGTLIAPNAVLTAAHCLHEYFVGDEVPGFTLASDANNAQPGQIVPGLSKHYHESFNLDSEPTEGVAHWYDIGVLILASDITWVPVEILPTPDEAAGLAADQNVELVGYGLIDLDTDDYGVKYNGAADMVEVGDYELWISKPGQQQNCNGDSGGPALVDLGNGRRLVGTVSRSPDDDPVCDHGGIDTRVDAYLAWIHDLVPGIPCGGLNGPCVDVPDAGPPRDAGAGSFDARPPIDAPLPPDAALPPDANPPDAAGPDAECAGDDGGDGGGCGCRTGGSSPTPPWSALLLGLGWLAVRSRRRRSAVRRPRRSSRA